MRIYVVDDFEAIRRRMDDLRGKNAKRAITGGANPPRGPRPYHVSAGRLGYPQRQAPAPGTDLKRNSRTSPMTLRDACRLTGRDGVTRCARCCLAARCLDDSRWLVSRHGRVL